MLSADVMHVECELHGVWGGGAGAILVLPLPQTRHLRLGADSLPRWVLCPAAHSRCWSAGGKYLHVAHHCSRTDCGNHRQRIQQDAVFAHNV